ncbi:MAG: hypothetical protein J6V83_00430 [Clostridia bacterium]|nr:hypothetical protein [Clostridia bacterium]
MLIKKTIVLSDGVRVVGHATVIRVGNGSAVKIALDTAKSGSLYIGLRFGEKPQQNIIIDGKKEYPLMVNPEHGDAIGMVVLNESGELIASGGRKEMVNRSIIIPRPQIVEETIKEEPKQVELITETFVSMEEPEEVEEITEAIPLPQEEVEEGLSGSELEDTLKAFSYNRGEHFYRSIRARLEEIMTVNPREDKLEALIPDSKWVKVYYDKGEYYVVGVLSEDGVVKFLAYGVPGLKGVKPPKEAEELCDFVSLPNGIGEGYWLMFQNAQNGEIVKSL